MLRQQCFHCWCCCHDSCWRSGCFDPKKGANIQSRDLFGGALQRSGHTGSISCHRFVTVEIQVTARAEVAPGEKVVGIDLGTTNSAVAAMEVLESTRHVWTFVDVCG